MFALWYGHVEAWGSLGMGPLFYSENMTARRSVRWYCGSVCVGVDLP